MNRQIGLVLDEHHGTRLDLGAKAVFWYCYMHLGEPASPKVIIAEMPACTTIGDLYGRTGKLGEEKNSEGGWGAGIEGGFHPRSDYPF